MKKTAFSLIELSVILLVIGVLAAIISKGGSLIYSARISSAQSTTSSSKVSQIDGLVVWYETVMDDSLSSDSRLDNKAVTYWQDISSQLNIAEEKNRLIGPDDNDPSIVKIAYRKEGINDLPSLQFTSSGNFVLTSLAGGVSNLGTVFAVLSPTLPLSGSMTFLDSANSNDNALSLRSSSFLFESGGSYSIANSFQSGEVYVVGLNMSDDVKLFVNNVDSVGSNTGSVINGFDGLMVGTDRGGADNFTGLISEIIIFDRILNVEERRRIMSYLAKKYSVRVEGAAS